MCLSRHGNLANQCVERERMRAVSRCKWLLAASALALLPAAALAQEAPAATNSGTGNASAPADSVGPKDLQNYTLNGTVTRPADQPAAAQPAPPERRTTVAAPTVEPRDQPAAKSAPIRAQSPAAAPAPRAKQTASAQPPAPQPQPASEPLRQSEAASSVTASLPALGAAGSGSATAAPAAVDFAPAPATLAPEHSIPLLPWLLAALALGLGGGFLFWRSRTRAAAFAGGPEFDLFTAPEPEPAPRPAPEAPRAIPAPPMHPAPAPEPASPESFGVVSSRLRPWIEIGFSPIRCVLDEPALTVEFELELFNSGSIPARGVRVDAAIFNAGPEQEQQIGTFIANPEGQGESIEIPPLKRLGLKTHVAIARDQVQAWEMAGKQVFLPVMAFNALYGWGGGEGQTSATYLLGRDTSADKLNPFRIDLGPRIFRTVAARLLPTGLRR